MSETTHNPSEKNLNFTALIALVVGSMIGGGIFSLPQNIAETASPGASLIGWIITGIGMLMLAFVFQNLAHRKPELDSGVYAYAQAGFGNYMGFNSAWGYWLSAWLGNVSYYVLIFSTLGYFFNVFGDGNTLMALVGASVLLWAYNFMITKGIQTATSINTLITIAKVIPLFTFIVIIFTVFNMDLFNSDFWGRETDLGSVPDQVKNMMMVTVWVFIGIEGASVYSARAKKRSDIGKATVLGFIFTLVLLMLVNFLAMGVRSLPELAAMKNPSMAYLLEYAVGPWGATFISVGLVVSLLGGLLAWTLFCAEVLFVAAKDETMPRFFYKTNAVDVPVNALLVSSAATQLFLVITYFSKSTYNNIFYLSTSMILIPYFFSAAYGFLVAYRKEGYKASESATKDIIIGVTALFYSIWLLYAAGIQYFLLSALLYLPGVVLYIKARREHKHQLFNTAEKVVLAVITVSAIYAAYGLYSGTLSL